MEFHPESTDEKTRKQNVCLSTQAKPSNKLGSMLNIENHERSYDDSHQLVKNMEKSQGHHKKKQQVERKIHKSEEVVKYMSYLPNYLERGENPKEKKPFNIGVLDWRLLEHYHKDSSPSQANSLSHHQHRINHPSTQSSGLEDSRRKDADLGGVPGAKSRYSGTDRKGNDRIHYGETFNAQEQLPNDHEFSERHNNPSDIPGNRHSSLSHQSDSSKGDNHTSSEANKYRSHFTNEGGKTKVSQLVQACSKEIRRTNCPSDKDHKIQFPSSASISTSRQKNLEKNNSGSKPRNFADNEAFKVKMGISEPTKVRNPSPTRRLSFGIGRIGKISVSDSKGTSASSCPTNSTCDKSNATSRARSSPLRRLLDPLLKPKGGGAKSSERNPSSGQSESPASHSVNKVKLDLKGCRTDDIITESHQNGPSTMQALLQVAVKNGLPLFTFTVDNCSDILAATVKELSCKKTEQAWIYTFFSFSEMKKKNAHWINQGSKDRNHGYISNVVAQMKVSDVSYSNSNRQREFVLSSLGRTDVDSLACDEVAAIVVKYPNNEGNEFPSDDITVTVILPGGNHGAPSKGEPSTLIQRWKSGGSCDCGGWDLGCRIRVLDNTNQLKSQRFNLTESQFKLFSQEEVEERKPMFVLSPFEDGIFSVEFSSTLKLIQAFSCGIAVLNSKTSPNMSQGMMLSENSVSAKYASYPPPVSPVGRV